jgi:transposase
MEAITTTGLDIAKPVFQVHGVDADGNVILRRQLKRRYINGILPEAATVPGWYRSLCFVALLVARTPSVRPHRSADAAGLCEAPTSSATKMMPWMPRRSTDRGTSI